MQGVFKKDVAFGRRLLPGLLFCPAPPLLAASLQRAPPCYVPPARHVGFVPKNKKSKHPTTSAERGIAKGGEARQANLAGAERGRARQGGVGRATPERSKVAQICSARGPHLHSISQNGNYAQRGKFLDKRQLSTPFETNATPHC